MRFFPPARGLVFTGWVPNQKNLHTTWEYLRLLSIWLDSLWINVLVQIVGVAVVALSPCLCEYTFAIIIKSTWPQYMTIRPCMENILKDPFDQKSARGNVSQLRKGRTGALNRVTETAGKKTVTEQEWWESDTVSDTGRTWDWKTQMGRMKGVQKTK